MAIDGNRMQVAAALQRLVDGQDIEVSANIVLSACRKLPVGRFSAGFWYEKDSDTMSGVSPGHGHVSIDDGDRKTVVKSVGVAPERIGNFRVWRAGTHRIEFCHYWGFELTTQSEDGPPTEFVIEHTSNHKMVRFGAMDFTIQRSFWFLHLTINRFRLIAGSRPMSPLSKYKLEIGNG